MLIRITGRAEVTRDDGGAVTARSIIRELDGVESDDACANYDVRLVDTGRGGVERFFEVKEQCHAARHQDMEDKELGLRLPGQGTHHLNAARAVSE